jgi:hypothetical protein
MAVNPLCKFCEFTHSPQASAKHFQQCAEFLPLRNRGFGTLAVTILPVPFARRAAATARAAVQPAAPLFGLRILASSVKAAIIGLC